MRSTFVVLSIVSIACGSPQQNTVAPAPSATSATPPAPHWSYEGDEGPARWGSLDPAWAACANGARQSPIDLPGARPRPPTNAKVEPSRTALPAIAYPRVPLTVANTGHTIQVDVHAPGTLTLDGRAFTLAQFHVHVPSEHTIAGQRFDAEMHFVNKSDADIAVLGVFVKKGAENATLAPMIDAAPNAKGERATGGEIDVQSLVPKKLRFERYAGSLTAPPCTEGVTWLVELPDAGIIELSPAQLDKLTAAMHGQNSRPLQDRKNREVNELE